MATATRNNRRAAAPAQPQKRHQWTTEERDALAAEIDAAGRGQVQPILDRWAAKLNIRPESVRAIYYQDKNRKAQAAEQQAAPAPAAAPARQPRKVNAVSAVERKRAQLLANIDKAQAELAKFDAKVAALVG